MTMVIPQFSYSLMHRLVTVLATNLRTLSLPFLHVYAEIRRLWSESIYGNQCLLHEFFKGNEGYGTGELVVRRRIQRIRDWAKRCGVDGVGVVYRNYFRLSRLAPFFRKDTCCSKKYKELVGDSNISLL